MKQFQKRLLLFAAILVGPIALLIIVCAVIIHQRADFTLTKKVPSVIFGRSHAECAFNDSLIGNFINLGHSGEGYVYTYSKIRKVLDDNPEIENVLVEFDNNQLDAGLDFWQWNDRYLQNDYVTYLPFLNISEHRLLLTRNPNGCARGLWTFLQHAGSRVVHHDYAFMPELGGYMYLTRNKTESLLKEPIHPTPGSSAEISDLGIEYLLKIKALVEGRRKKLILVRSPMHPLSSEFINEQQLQETLKNVFADVVFLDFKDFPLAAFEYGDLEHLNYKGARKFSGWFDQLLKDGLLTRTDKQEFLEREKLKVQQAMYLPGIPTQTRKDN